MGLKAEIWASRLGGGGCGGGGGEGGGEKEVGEEIRDEERGGVGG